MKTKIKELVKKITERSTEKENRVIFKTDDTNSAMSWKAVELAHKIQKEIDIRKE